MDLADVSFDPTKFDFFIFFRRGRHGIPAVRAWLGDGSERETRMQLSPCRGAWV